MTTRRDEGEREYNQAERVDARRDMIREIYADKWARRDTKAAAEALAKAWAEAE